MANPFNVLNETSAGARLGSALGTGLGSGLSSGIQLLAQQKLNEIAQRSQQQKASALWEMAGLSPELSRAFAAQPESIQKSLLERLEGLNFSQSETQQQLLGIPEKTMPQVQQIEPGAPKSELTPVQIPQQQQITLGPNPIERRHRETLEFKKESAKEKSITKKQQAIDTSNKSFLDQLNKAVPIAEEMHDKAQEMLNLLNGGKVTSGLGGIAGRITGGLSLNPESQRFLALSNDIASLLAANSGVATNFKIKFAQERKPNLQQKPETQKALTEDIIKQANKVLEREQIKNNLIAENNYNQPANIKAKIDEEYKKVKPKKAAQQKNAFKELPDPQQFAGKKIRDTVTGEILQSDGAEWKRIS